MMPCQGETRSRVNRGVIALARRDRDGWDGVCPMSGETTAKIENHFQDDRLEPVWWALRVGFGVAVFLAGLDKFLNVLTDWPQYLHPAVACVVAPETFMRVVGVIEMIVGVAILTRLTRWASLVAGFWLLGIVANLLAQGRFLDIAVRDVLMAIAVFGLSRLTAVRESHVALRRDADGRLRQRSA